MQVKDKDNIIECSNEIRSLKDEIDEMVRRGSDVMEWCPFCEEGARTGV